MFEHVSRVIGKNGGGLSITESGMLRENLPGIGRNHFRFRLFERIRRGGSVLTPSNEGDTWS